MTTEEADIIRKIAITLALPSSDLESGKEVMPVLEKILNTIRNMKEDRLKLGKTKSKFVTDFVLTR